METIHDIETFDRFMETTKEQVLFFHMSCCAPCHDVEPVLINIERKVATIRPATRFLKIDVEEVPGLMCPFRVESVPRIIVMRDCVQVGETIVGRKPKDEIVAMVADALGMPLDASAIEDEIEPDDEEDIEADENGDKNDDENEEDKEAKPEIDG